MTDTHLSIRPADPAEAGRLTEIAHRSKAHWGYPESWIRAWSGELTVTPGEVARSFARVAVDDAGEPAGFAVVEPGEGGTALLRHLWVLPERIGEGVGRLLLHDALAGAAQLGAVALELDADPHAAAFYARMGADVVGVVQAPMPGADDRWLPRMRFRVSCGAPAG